MAEIQSALPESFLQVAGAQKSGKKGAAASLQLASFFGVLKSQLAKKAEIAADATGLEVKGGGGKNPLLAQVDANTPLPAASADKPAPAVVGEPVPQVVEAVPQVVEAAVAAVVVMEKVAAKVEAALPKTAKNEANPISPSGEAGLADPADPAVAANSTQPVGLASLADPTAEAGVKSVGAAKPDAMRKAGAAANAADAGQTLPLAASSQHVAAAQFSAIAKADTALEGAVPPALSSLADSQAASQFGSQIGSPIGSPVATPIGARADGATTTPISLAHPFEQALRQAEAKVNVAIEAPVRSAAFAAELSDKVVWLAGRQGQFADLSLNPPQMGSLEVRLTLSGGDASAQFFSPNPAVREAIDAALPKLRELMSQAGINLGEAEVRDQAFARREHADLPRQAAAQDGDVAANQAALAGMGMVRSSGLGLVDLYI